MPTKTVTLKDGRQVKLGRLPPRERKEAPMLVDYFDEAGSHQPPDSTNWGPKASRSIDRMYLNDQYGDCVIAGKHHAMGVWTGNDSDSGGIALSEDREVYQQYQQICGPGDNGCVITDVLDWWRDRGLSSAGKVHKIDGYVGVDNTNTNLVKWAIALFGGLTLGIDLPGDWTCTDCVWDVTRSRVVGGHDVRAYDYDAQGVKVATWAGTSIITWKAFTSRNWITECWCELSADWYNADRIGASGLRVEELQDDLRALGQGQPPPEPGPTPTPPPGPTPTPTPPGPEPEGNHLHLTSALEPGYYQLGGESRSPEEVQLRDVLGQLGFDWRHFVNASLAYYQALLAAKQATGRPAPGKTRRMDSGNTSV